jgi:hypothetical protein
MLPPFLHGTPREHYLVLFGAAGVIAVVTGTVSAWVGAQFGARRAARLAAEQAFDAHAAIEASLCRRLDLLQQSLETVAVEVERVSEAHRFSVKQQAERMRRHDAPVRHVPRVERADRVEHTDRPARTAEVELRLTTLR